MKIKVLITTLLFSFSLYGQTLEECQLDGEKYGDGKTKTFISSGCETLFESKAASSAIKNLSDKDIKVFGYKNMLFMRIGINSGLKESQIPQELDTLVITGHQPGFKEVLSVDIDYENKTVVALVIDRELDKEAILTFDLLIGGNITPRRQVKSDELVGSTSLSVDSANGKIHLNYSDGRKASLNLLENTYGKKNPSPSIIFAE